MEATGAAASTAAVMLWKQLVLLLQLSCFGSKRCYYCYFSSNAMESAGAASATAPFIPEGNFLVKLERTCPRFDYVL